MGNAFTVVVVIMLSAVVIFIVPVMTMAERVDTISQTDVETIVSEFINEIKTIGELPIERLSKLEEDLTATGGNLYNIELEFKILDENPGKKTSQTAKDKIGENVYYSIFTTQIKEELERMGVYNLKPGDIVSITVRNTNLTSAQEIKDFIYKMLGSDIYTIVDSQSALVIGTGTATE